MNILIVSPQPWNHIPISKHNYAIALARRGQQVIFLNPPDDEIAVLSQLVRVAEEPTLQILSYRRPWFYRMRFHLPPVFDWLMSRKIRQLMARHQISLDLVWCFDFNTFPDLSVFGATRRIFHPVDPLSDARHLALARSADLVLTVSTRIANQLAAVGRSVHVINHGLAAPFEKLARERLTALEVPEAPNRGTAIRDRVHVGYAGNLGRRPVNRAVLTQIVEQHPDVHFHFWGPTDAERGVATEFLAFLRQRTNVTVHGAVTQAELATAYRDMDAFLLSYTADPKESDLSNSHKILEYLSTGKVVISSRIEAYASHPELIEMSKSTTDIDLPQLFATVVARLPEMNASSHQRARIAFALDHTYDRQIDRIFQLLETSTT